jgi:hypothetical protein
MGTARTFRPLLVMDFMSLASEGRSRRAGYFEAARPQGPAVETFHFLRPASQDFNALDSAASCDAAFRAEPHIENSTAQLFGVIA